MALVYVGLFGGTQALTEFASTAGAASIDTSTLPPGGGASLKLNVSSPAVTASAQRQNVLADAGRRVMFWFRYSATPAVTGRIWRCVDTSGNEVFSLGLSTGNILGISNSAGTTLASGSTTLSSGTWYCLRIAYTITSTTVYSIKVWIDTGAGGGSPEVSISNGTALGFTTALHSNYHVSAALGANWTANYGPLLVDDGAGLDDIGVYRITAKRPNANGTANSFDTVGTSGSGYGTGRSQFVNERPLSSAAGHFTSHAANGTTAEENFTIENAATGDVDITGWPLYGRSAWIHASGVSTDQLVDNGSAAVPASANVSGSAGLRWTLTLSSTYPSASNAIGMKRPNANATDAALNECGVVLVYSAPTVSQAAAGTGTTSRALQAGLPRAAAATGTAARTLQTGLSRLASATGSASRVLAVSVARLAAATGTATRVVALALVRTAAATGTASRELALTASRLASATGSAARTLTVGLPRAVSATGAAARALTVSVARLASAAGTAFAAAVKLAGSTTYDVAALALATGAAASLRLVGAMRAASAAGAATRAVQGVLPRLAGGTGSVSRALVVHTTRLAAGMGMATRALSLALERAAAATGAAALALTRVVVVLASAAGAATSARALVYARDLLASAIGAASSVTDRFRPTRAVLSLADRLLTTLGITDARLGSVALSDVARATLEAMDK